MAALALLDQERYQQSIEDSARRRQAEYNDYQRELQYARQAAAIEEQATEEQLRHQAAMKGGDPYAQITAERQILQLRVQLAEQAERLADADLKRAQALGQQLEIERAQLNLASAQAGVAAAKGAQDESQVVARRGQANVWQVLFGDSVTSLKDFNTALKDGRSAVNMFSNFLQALPSLIQGVKQGYESGGIAGAIGSGMQMVGQFVPGPAGAVLQIGGAVLSTIGQIFGNQAEKIARQIRNNLEQIAGAYSTGQVSLIDTMSRLQAQANDAIARLSGVKGGKSKLQEILKQVQDEMIQLQQQREQIIGQFDLSYRQLELWSQGRSQDIVDLITQSRDMFKQIGDYMGAGGDAQKALQFLQWSMEQEKAKAASEYRDAEAQAIQDALQLNDLLQQRVDLEKQYSQSVYEAMSKDSIERRTSQAVTIGRQIGDLTAKYKDNLQNLNSQIDLEQQKVAAEKTVFNIASDTATLQKQAAADALASLQEQLKGYRDLASIIKGAYDYLYDWNFVAKWNPTTMGNIRMPSGGGVTYNSPVTIAPGAITVVAAPGANGTTIGQQIGNELARQFRYGLRPSYGR